MIAKCTQCGHGHDLQLKGEQKLEESRCEKCGGALEVADLRWCFACGTTTQDVHLMAPSFGDMQSSVTLDNQEIPAVRYFVAPGTTHCPKGHAFRAPQRKG